MLQLFAIWSFHGNIFGEKIRTFQKENIREICFFKHEISNFRYILMRTLYRVSCDHKILVIFYSYFYTFLYVLYIFSLMFGL